MKGLQNIVYLFGVVLCCVFYFASAQEIDFSNFTINYNVTYGSDHLVDRALIESGGIAGTTTWTDPATKIVHTFYLWKIGNTGTVSTQVPLIDCQSVSPAVVRSSVPKTDTVFLASIVTDGERTAVRDMIKAQKAPWVFSQLESFWVDNVFDHTANNWVSIMGTCHGNYLPWGDACGSNEPEPGNPKTDYCTTFDMRSTLLCKAGDKCYDGKTYNPSRSCNYDGVYNNVPCDYSAILKSQEHIRGCIFESQPYPIPPAQISCSGSGAAVLKCGNDPSLINNGDFEIGQYVTGTDAYSFSAGDGGIFGWTIASGTVTVNQLNQAASGKRAINLSGGKAAVLQQVVSVDRTRRAYTLNFKLAANPQQGAPANRPVLVTILTSGGQTIASQTYNFDSTGKTAANMGWSSQSLNWNSVSGETFYTIQFQPAAPSTASIGPTIDAVTLCAGAVIAPASACDAGGLAQNNDFELGTFVANSGNNEALQTGSTVLPNWSVNVGPVYWMDSKSVQNVGNSKHSIQLPAVTPHPRLQQTITTDGKRRLYTINFYLSGMKGGSVPVKSIMVHIQANSNPIDRIASGTFTFDTSSITGDQVTANKWLEFSQHFTSTDGVSSYTIIFEGVTPADSQGALIDLISICQGDIVPLGPGPCTIGRSPLKNRRFQNGDYSRSYTGSSKSFVGIGQGTYDLLTPTSGGQNIYDWNITAGQVLYSSSTWKNYDSTTVRSIGLLPGASISQSFDISAATAAATTAYALDIWAASNPWNTDAKQSSITVNVFATNTAGPVITIIFPIPATPVSTAANMVYTKFAISFPTRPGQATYTIQITDSSKSTYGTVVARVVACTTTQTITPTTDYCNGKKQYLGNNYFSDVTGTHDHAVFDTYSVGNSAKLAPWNVTSGSIDHIYSLWQHAVGSTFSVDLSGNSAGAIAQSFKLPSAAAPYELKFALSGNPEGPPTVKNLQIVVKASTGAIVHQENFIFPVTGNTEKSMGWVERTMSFVSTAGVTDYTIILTSLDNTAFGPVVDNVFLCEEGTPISRGGNDGKCALAKIGAPQVYNFIKNGGFESVIGVSQTDQVVNFKAASPGLLEWTVDKTDVDLVRAPYWQPQEGTNSIDMNGDSPSQISQNLNLGTIASPFTLSFWLSPTWVTPPQTKQVTVTVKSVTGVVVATKSISITTTTESKANSNWKQQTISFNSLDSVASYTLTIASVDPNPSSPAGMSLDDVVLCGYDPNVPRPVSIPADKLGELSITADNTFEIYIDGSEVVPQNADTISFSGACKGQQSLGPSKYCCVGHSSHPRCDWEVSETYNISVNELSIIAVHVTNFWSDPVTKNTAATPPLQGGGNPAMLLASYKRDGRVCSVTDSEWRCTFTGVAAADKAFVATPAWTQLMYDDSTWQSASGLFGTNNVNSWVPFGGKTAALYGGQSIWWGGQKSAPQPGIASYAQYIWADGTSAQYSEMWCRLYVPNIYC